MGVGAVLGVATVLGVGAVGVCALVKGSVGIDAVNVAMSEGYVLWVQCCGSRFCLWSRCCLCRCH